METQEPGDRSVVRAWLACTPNSCQATPPPLTLVPRGSERGEEKKNC